MTKRVQVCIRFGLLGGMALGLAACGLFPQPVTEVPVAAVVEPAAGLTAMGEGVTAASLDSTSAAEKAAALAAGATAGARELGTVTVALGSPTEQGFWIKCNLVAVPAKGRVETEDGASVAVDLIPTDGAAILSFAAFRALGLPLTDLPDVTVFAD